MTEPSSIDRDRLIEAAWNVLDRTGFEGFKVASVIRATGSSARSFYRYFESKDELFIELLLDESRRGSARIDRLVAAADDPVAAVTTWIAATSSAATIPELMPRVRLFATLSARVEGHREAIDESRRMLRRSLEQAIEDGRVDGRFTSPDPTADAALIQSLCGTVMNDIVFDRATEDAPTAIGNVQRFVLQALRSPGP